MLLWVNSWAMIWTESTRRDEGRWNRPFIQQKYKGRHCLHNCLILGSYWSNRIGCSKVWTKMLSTTPRGSVCIKRHNNCAQTKYLRNKAGWNPKLTKSIIITLKNVTFERGLHALRDAFILLSEKGIDGISLAYWGIPSSRPKPLRV